MERFWSKVEKTEICWLWKAGTYTNGYGKFHYKGAHHRAHRVVWEITYGSVPDGFKVLHACDVKSCVRPSHLFIGTQQDNIRDAIRKGRFKQGHIALSSEIRDAICNAYMKREGGYRCLAKRFGVSRSVIQKFVRHMQQHGGQSPACQRALSDHDAINVLTQYKSGGVGIKKLARAYGVSRSTIRALVRRQSYRHIIHTFPI